MLKPLYVFTALLRKREEAFSSSLTIAEERLAMARLERRGEVQSSPVIGDLGLLVWGDGIGADDRDLQ
ncbi:hypothetical protein MRB53_033102 [Persea americana]|uniref:Uncharacterized protein n=1 Tax=Persea americana TaxID=3435 RepID=A0ACC2KUS4_PERAE|nr:hypothetical protein MRB53_033102 [Persea americana]